MRTTIRMDDDLLRRLKEQAARTGRSMTSLIEDAVRESLARVETRQQPTKPLPVFGGSGTLPGVDLADTRSLIDAMEKDEPLDALR